MSTTPHDDLAERLQQMPVSEKLSILLLSVIEQKRGHGYGSVRGVLEVAAVMARYLNDRDRESLSCVLRDMADQFERPLAMHTN